MPVATPEAPSVQEVNGSSPLSTSRRALRLYRPHLAALGLLAVISLLMTTAEMSTYLVIRRIFDDAFGGKSVSTLAIYCGLLLVLPAVVQLFGLVQTHVSARIGQGIIRDLRNRLYSHLLAMPLRFFTQTKQGEIEARFSSDLAGLQQFATNTVTQILSSCVTMLATVTLMVLISPVLTIVSVAILPVFLLNHFWTARIRGPLMAERQTLAASFTSLLVETLSIGGVILAKTFGRRQMMEDVFEKENDRLLANELRQQLVGQWGFMGLGTLISAIPASMFFIAGWQLITGSELLGAKMTIGTAVAFSALQGRFFAPAAQLLNSQAEIHQALTMLKRVYEYLDRPAQEQPQPGKIVLRPEQVQGHVIFRNVGFSYEAPAAASAEGSLTDKEGSPVSSRPTLRDISFSIPPGHMTALVGRSGSGKTTIAYLLSRLYEADTGSVEIDGHDIRTLRLESIPDFIGVVTQEPFLLHGSVRRNLLFARPDATEEQVIAAARAAAIHDRIMELPEQYETVVGERGYKFSGGEKQRLAIARVFLRNPPILVLDEATSALDTHSERLVREALDALVHSRTTLVIAHRLSTIKSANQIIVLDRGEIVESGNHEALLRQGKVYAGLYNEQVLHAPRED